MKLLYCAVLGHFHYNLLYIESWCCTVVHLHCGFVVFVIPLMPAVYTFILF